MILICKIWETQFYTRALVLLKLSVQSLSCVWLFAAPWTAARQASLSFINSQNLLKLMPTESVMISNHLVAFSSFLQSFPALGSFLRSQFFASATAKSLQSCPTLCAPRDNSPPGSPIPGILQPRTLEWVAISLSNAWKWKVKVKSLSHVRLLATPWTVVYQAPPSMGFSRQEYWSGVPLPSPMHESEKWKWPKYSGLTSFRIDWFDLLAVQGTLKSLPTL